MTKNRLVFKNVVIDTNVNKDGELYNKLYVNFNEDEKNYYRLGDFLSFAEKNILKAKYNFDLETIQLLDITKHIQYVELVKDETKYGTRQYFNVHFDIGYDMSVKVDNDNYFFLNIAYKQEKVITSSESVTTKK